MTKPKSRLPAWLKGALAVLTLAALAAGGQAVRLTLRDRTGAPPPPDPATEARDNAYKSFSDRLDGYRECRADADCVRVKADCACTGVSKARLEDFKADYAKTAADAGLSSCVDWPEPSCQDATSSPVCVHRACRVHVVIEDAVWDQ